EVEARALGLKSDSILAVASRYSKLAPVALAACLIALATRARALSTPSVAGVPDMSTDIWCPAPRGPHRLFERLFSQREAQMPVTLRRLWLTRGKRRPTSFRGRSQTANPPISRFPVHRFAMPRNDGTISDT